MVLVLGSARPVAGLQPSHKMYAHNIDCEYTTFSAYGCILYVTVAGNTWLSFPTITGIEMRL